MAYQAKSNDFRRTWNTDEYEEKARERSGKKADSDDEEDGARDEDTKEVAPKPKSLLKPREQKIDLESKLGKTTVISKTTPSSQAGGFYCDVCDCIVKDSINYLDHCNGKKHQRNMGMTMKIKKSTLDDVKDRFEMLKRKKDEKVKEYDVQERMRELKEEEERLKEYRKVKKIEKKRRREESDDEDDEMAKVMGFSKFSKECWAPCFQLNKSNMVDLETGSKLIAYYTALVHFLTGFYGIYVVTGGRTDTFYSPLFEFDKTGMYWIASFIIVYSLFFIVCCSYGLIYGIKSVSQYKR
ncbi:Zinc finger matrin-type protein 2 [Halotydeus destructor]|nr:Zinc finger matrin-type protein 2 [Halotydeus destructor]